MIIYNKDTSNPDNIEIIEHAKQPLSSDAVLGDVAIRQVDFVYLMTQLDAMEILLREDNFKMYSRSSLKKMVMTLKKEFEKYLSNVT